MTLAIRIPSATTYRVEVSGWDSNRHFFVAKADLEWSDENGKCVALARAISDGSILFVRLVHAMDATRSMPVPYEAEEIGELRDGTRQFRLHPVQPRNAER